MDPKWPEFFVHFFWLETLILADIAYNDTQSWYIDFLITQLL